MQNLHVDSYRPDASTAALDCDIAIVGGGIVGATLAAGVEGYRTSYFAELKSTPWSRLLLGERGYALSPLSGKIP